ncbi:hypothetical protein BDK51DRAFT_42549 [Blyttiomyces helicus]|uniref:Uncharacterized protein n=1 Tax=Blyttiomyces helicus TaxID=388810 RepID=A0A4P9VYV9_9FUNG|nr:hypothetical protein BDK51DRAFT_42549 [Blyttiomyces helicus]|eukprot:RKO83953.1 hypothetical protein BDK51DRAFT_42549 [Blyttiomyces helicus]
MSDERPAEPIETRETIQQCSDLISSAQRLTVPENHGPDLVTASAICARLLVVPPDGATPPHIVPASRRGVEARVTSGHRAAQYQKPRSTSACGVGSALGARGGHFEMDVRGVGVFELPLGDPDWVGQGAGSGNPGPPIRAPQHVARPPPELRHFFKKLAGLRTLNVSSLTRLGSNASNRPQWAPLDHPLPLPSSKGSLPSVLCCVIIKQGYLEADGTTIPPRSSKTTALSFTPLNFSGLRDTTAATVAFFLCAKGTQLVFLAFDSHILADPVVLAGITTHTLEMDDIYVNIVGIDHDLKRENLEFVRVPART